MGKETGIPSPELLKFRSNAKTTAVKKQKHGKTPIKNMDPSTQVEHKHRRKKTEWQEKIK